jgi:phage gpG-like protein
MMTPSFIIGRMNVLAKSLAPGSPAINEALLRIAMMVIAKAKINVRRHRMVDTGRLINSLRWEFYRQGDTEGVYIGSFGVRYAAMNEFGGEVSERQRRAMFAAFGNRKIRLPSKGIITKSGAGWRWKPRPYLRPALKESQQYIIETIREYLRQK